MKLKRIMLALVGYENEVLSYEDLEPIFNYFKNNDYEIRLTKALPSQGWKIKFYKEIPETPPQTKPYLSLEQSESDINVGVDNVSSTKEHFIPINSVKDNAADGDQKLKPKRKNEAKSPS